jgi:thymidylate synthase (FAD)
MNVELVSHTPRAEELIASAYGICTNRDVPIERIPKWIDMGHLSPIEHASATFEISDISRACSHQLVRHRLASYSQQSQRYVSWEVQCAEVLDLRGEAEDWVYSGEAEGGKNGPWDKLVDKLSTLFVQPPSMRTEAWVDAMVQACQNYYFAVKHGELKPEDARFFLPNAAKTELMMTANFREWRHIIQLRTSPAAQWEIAEVARRVLQELTIIAPYVFGDL